MFLMGYKCQIQANIAGSISFRSIQTFLWRVIQKITLNLQLTTIVLLDGACIRLKMILKSNRVLKADYIIYNRKIVILPNFLKAKTAINNHYLRQIIWALGHQMQVKEVDKVVKKRLIIITPISMIPGMLIGSKSNRFY